MDFVIRASCPGILSQLTPEFLVGRISETSCPEWWRLIREINSFEGAATRSRFVRLIRIRVQGAVQVQAKFAIPRSPFVPDTAVYTTAPAYVWDAYDPYSVLGDRDPSTDEIVRKLTERARIAYALGCAEWVVFTLSPLIEDDRPMQQLQAFWAFQMSDRYALPHELIEAEWQGPVRGPIDLSLVTVRNTVATIEDGEAYIHASFAERIPQYTLRDPAPFLTWRAHALKALTEFASATNSERGDPIPRELMMNSPELYQRLPPGEWVDRLLASVDPTRNPYLIPVA
jgi:hypothetical protein